VKVVITVAVTDDDGTTHAVTCEEHSWQLGDRDDVPPVRVASKAMARARKALARLVAPTAGH
jgi:hypothetical protein